MGTSRVTAACVALVLLAVPGRAQAAVQVEITEFGEYTVQRELGPSDAQSHSTGIRGVMTVDGVAFVDRTTRIEARLCHRFGIAFMGRGLDPVAPTRFTIRMRHPALAVPGQGVVDESTYEEAVNGTKPGLAGYSFDSPWELTPGTWTFAVLLDGRVMAEKAFEVVPPDAPDTARAGPCSVPVS